MDIVVITEAVVRAVPDGSWTSLGELVGTLTEHPDGGVINSQPWRWPRRFPRTETVECRLVIRDGDGSVMFDAVLPDKVVILLGSHFFVDRGSLRLRLDPAPGLGGDADQLRGAIP